MNEYLLLVAQEVASDTGANPAAESTAPGDTTATEQAPGGATPVAPTQPGGNGIFGFFLPIALMIGVFYLIMYRGGRKDRKKHDDMLRALKRNDRIQTIGGIIGTVVEAREQEVIVKVDESSNVKMHFVRGAIKDVLSEAPPDSGSK
jgi:preprotein translocase subunit YajC